MIPQKFPAANKHFKAPPDFAESQVRTVPAYIGTIKGGSCDGQNITVVAWRPTEEELHALNEGAAVHVTWFGLGLVPHMLTTNFQEATHPA